MRAVNLTHIFIFIITFGFLMTSCENEDNASIKNIEGHWLYKETKIDISVTDPALRKSVEEYISKKQENTQISYEFKNDKTYFCHREQTDPLKGKFKMLEKNYYMIDDIRGEKKIFRENGKMYVLSDLRREIALQLNVDTDKIIEANITEVFDRGLSPTK